MTGCGSWLGTRAGSRRRLSLRCGMPYPEHPDDTHHCCAEDWHHCCAEDWEVLQLDVQTAFLDESVQGEVFVKTPPGHGSADVATGLYPSAVERYVADVVYYTQCIVVVYQRLTRVLLKCCYSVGIQCFQ